MRLIDRQAAIEALEREKSLVERPITETRWFDLGLGKAQDVLSKLPSAEGKPIKCEVCKTIIALKAALEPVKTGKWVEDEDPTLPSHCSVCGEHALEWVETRYCPWCGAKMEREE